MRKIHDYIWTFPLSGGIISLIALVTPAAHLNDSSNIFFLWMWGLFLVRVDDPFYKEITFSDNIFIITPSIISSILIGISAILLISSAITLKKDITKYSRVKNNWLTPAILIIISTIGWIISIELAYKLGPSSISFWESIEPGFGVIGMFLASGFAIGGFAISKHGAQQRDEVISITNKPEILKTPPISSQSGINTLFCPECGMKTKNAFQRFCINCGFKLD